MTDAIAATTRSLAARLPRSLIAIADQGVISGANFAILLAVARGATAAGFGLFALLWSIRLFAANLHSALVLQPVGVMAPEASVERRASYLARVERCTRWVAAMAIAASLAACSIGGLAELAALTSLTFATRAAADLHRRIAYLDGDASGALVIDSAANGPLIAYALAVVLGAMPISCASALIAAAASGALGWAVGLARNRASLAAAMDPLAAVARRHWRVGGWLLGGTLASWGANQLYPFLVAGTLGLEEVGALSACRSLIGVTQVPLQALDAQGLPRARKAYLADGAPALLRVLATLAMVVGITVAAVCLAVAAFPGEALRLVYGTRYLDVTGPLRWLAAQQLVIAIGYLVNIGLLAIGEPRCGFWARIGACVATVALGPMMIRIWGLNGACAAMLLNSVAIVLVGCIWFARRIGRRERPTKEVP